MIQAQVEAKRTAKNTRLASGESAFILALVQRPGKHEFAAKA
ncbi:hypothetical protein [Methylocapsa acidiphila]|nr:hypothetical protein [Methylocapsa acidiphila]